MQPPEVSLYPSAKEAKEVKEYSLSVYQVRRKQNSWNEMSFEYNGKNWVFTTSMLSGEVVGA